MVRRHGWQLPAHPFQIVAITVFLLLVVAFYVFLFPFLGNPIVEYIAVGVYSPVAIAAFVLYFRCTAIDPSDPGILDKSSQKSANGFQKSDVPKSPQGLSASARSSSVAPSDFESKVAWVEECREQALHKEVNRNTHGWGALICGLLVYPDNCRDDKQENPQSTADDEALFCTLCNAEVRKFSKHCRNCDKCVDGFDHHCRWLNNCVGRKNYTTFILLMATSLLLLVLDCGTGLAVMVRCFVDRSSVDAQIVEKLGNGFSRIPFATIVAICTFVSFLAALPLGELFFFHLILIKKGITTYEYVVAMRAQNESQGGPDGEHQSVPSSPTSSAATGLSGSSSIGLQYRGAWCTPPRIFVEHQDEVVPHLAPGRVPSTVDPDAGKTDGKIQRQQVRISAWKLAKLDPDEATRAAAKAREKSSVLRPLKGPDSTIPDTDFTSSMSSSSVSTDFAVAVTGHIAPKKDTAQPIQYLSQRPVYNLGGVGSKTESDTRTQSSYSSPSRTSMNESNGASPLSIQDRLGVLHIPPSQQQFPNQAIRQDMFRPTSSKYFASKGELSVYPPYGAVAAVDELINSKASQINRNLRESKRTAVFWDGAVRRPRAMIGITDPHNIVRGEPSQLKIQNMARSGSTHSSSGDLTSTTSDNILYNGTSIFFGGPLCPPVSVQRDGTNASASNHVNDSRPHGQDNRFFNGHFMQSELPVFAPHSKE